MREHAWGIAIVAVVLSAAACGSVDDEALRGRATSGGVINGTDTTGTTPASEGINATGQGAGTGAYTGLPCEVQQLLENRCIGCHLGPSPAALLTYADLVKPSASNGGQKMAEVALSRMKSASSPMPPAPAVAPTAQEIATMEAWVNAGTPKGAACTTGASPRSDASNPYTTPSVCTSGTTWGGGEASSSMDPGRPCITCHTTNRGPAFALAGTVYPSAHEPNDCNGVAGGVSVVVMDTSGAALATIPVNSVGNFGGTQSITPPFRVKVVGNGKERAMGGTLTAGDCNTCHTETGVNGAPGRIMAP